MKKGENLKRDSLPTMQQVRYLMKLYEIGAKKGAVMKVAKACGVDHGAVSRYFKACRERGFLDDGYGFTELGKARVKGYQKIISGLEDFFCGMGLTEEQIGESTRKQVENVDYDVLLYMVKELGRGGRGGSVERHCAGIPHGHFPADIFTPGRTPVWFMVLHLQEGGRTGVSMADRGFAKPACLDVQKEGAWIELRITEMTATSRVDGREMHGHLESLKYARDGFLYLAEIGEDGIVKIPLDACRFHRYKGGEMKGAVQITATCNVGRTHMPESTAVLLFWL